MNIILLVIVLIVFPASKDIMGNVFKLITKKLEHVNDGLKEKLGDKDARE